jgi:hypothetical protein
MTLIQIILIAGFLMASILCFAALKNRSVARLFFLSQFALGVILVILPDLSQRAAELLGVGRGTDLVLYLLVVYVYIGSILILGKFRHLESTLTELARKIALADPKHPESEQGQNQPRQSK